MDDKVHAICQEDDWYLENSPRFSGIALMGELTKAGVIDIDDPDFWTYFRRGAEIAAKAITESIDGYIKETTVFTYDSIKQLPDPKTNTPGTEKSEDK